MVAHGTDRRLLVDLISQPIGVDLCREQSVDTAGGHGKFPQGINVLSECDWYSSTH